MSLPFVSLVIRVRRRGFPREVRRGFDVQRPDGVYRVVRRSNWNLWLEKLPEPRHGSGSIVRVRLSERNAAARCVVCGVK